MIKYIYIPSQSRKIWKEFASYIKQLAPNGSVSWAVNQLVSDYHRKHIASKKTHLDRD